MFIFDVWIKEWGLILDRECTVWLCIEIAIKNRNNQNEILYLRYLYNLLNCSDFNLLIVNINRLSIFCKLE